jgi:hypothetical protein
MKQRFIAMLAAFALGAAPAMAEEAPVYVWVNSMKAKPGQSDAFTAMVIEDDAKVFDKLVAGGAALDWGVAMPVVHDGDDAGTLIEWVTLAGYAGADAFMKEFMAQREAMGPEGNKAMMERYAAVMEPGSHSDTILRSIHQGSGKAARPAYIHLSYYQARPGKGRDATAQFKEYTAPVYDQLVADGTINAYGLGVPDLHRGETWTHLVWFSSASLAARDKVDAAFEAADAARSEAELEARRQRWRETLDPAGHSDQILVVVHHKTK